MIHGLHSLMYLRVDTHGELAILEEQDRSKWDSPMVLIGFEHLDRCASGDEMTPYHAQAALAAAHADPQADWEHIVRLYDDLLPLQPTRRWSR